MFGMWDHFKVTYFKGFSIIQRSFNLNLKPCFKNLGLYNRCPNSPSWEKMHCRNYWGSSFVISHNFQLTIGNVFKSCHVLGIIVDSFTLSCPNFGHKPKTKVRTQSGILTWQIHTCKLMGEDVNYNKGLGNFSIVPK
jgi:hypothetical protein